MRLAIFSDVHGNPYACRALLQAVADAGPFDALVAAGDLCLGGSDPGGTLDMLRQAGVLAVYGNTEEYLAQPQRIPPDDLHRSQWDVLLPIIHWTNAQLRDEHLDWLNALPFQRRFSPTSRAEDGLLVVHANPRNCETMLYPSQAEQHALWQTERQPDDDAELCSVMEGFEEGTLAHGHLHTLGLRSWRQKTLVNVAAVSLPAIDHDRRARFSILTWENGSGNHGWKVERRWVEYDAQQEVQALSRCGMPGYERFARTFDNQR